MQTLTCKYGQVTIRDFDTMTKTCANLSEDMPKVFKGVNLDMFCESCADCSEGVCGLDMKPCPKHACAALTRQDCGNCGVFSDCNNQSKKKETAFCCNNYKVFVRIEN